MSTTPSPPPSLPPAAPVENVPRRAPADVTHLRDLSAVQWKSGIAAWLGWLFDGLDMNLYTLVAVPFVAELLVVDKKDPSVGYYSSWIQAAFLVGWALGGSVFGRLGDRLGRSRALMRILVTRRCRRFRWSCETTCVSHPARTL